MGIKTNVSSNKEDFTICIDGEFNFSCLNEFNNSYNNVNARSAKKIIIDLKETNIIDSSALGMLLNMQKDLGKSLDNTVIINCNVVVLKILKITNFSKKFTVIE